MQREDPHAGRAQGEQGTGKSILFDFLRKGLGCSALKVTQDRHLVGNFNSHLDGKLLLVCEEAFWGGNKQSAGVIKDLISADTLTIEAKHENAVTRPNLLSLAFISNESWIIPTDGSDARRFLVLEASNQRKQDQAYFTKIFDQMADGGLEAMVHDLINWQGDWTKLRFPPVTDSLRQQARMGLSGPMATLIKILEEGVLEGRTESGDVYYYELSVDEPTRIARTHLNESLYIKAGRGSDSEAGRAAIKTLLGDKALNDNRSKITYRGAITHGVRDHCQTETRVPFVEVPPLKDMIETLARYGASPALDIEMGSSVS